VLQVLQLLAWLGSWVQQQLSSWCCKAPGFYGVMWLIRCRSASTSARSIAGRHHVHGRRMPTTVRQ
jgi:hypothetical protein